MFTKLTLTLTVFFIGLFAFATPAEARNPTDVWHVQVDQDPFTDAVETGAFRTSTEALDWRGAEVLYFRCSDGQLDIFVATHDVLDRKQMRVKVRFDRGDVEFFPAGRAQSGDALFITSPKRFLRRLLLARRVVIGVKPYDARVRGVVFTLPNVKKKLRPILQHCPLEG